MSRLLLSLLLLISGLSAHATEKPNILWIYAEDTSPWMGCYGDVINAGATPHIDSIADSGVRFTRAYVPAPVCSATRSAMMVGQNAIRFGGHEHRSSRGAPKIHLPEAYQLLPKLLQDQGYTTFNHGKTDYNYVWDATIYNYAAKSKTDFSDLVRRQPFFGQIQTKGGKNNTWKFPANRKVDPARVTVPADYPDNRIYREVVAQHYDAIRMDDDLVGEILSGLEAAGLADNTIVVYFSDHGANNLLRHKQMATEGGLHVPFIIMGPDAWVPQQGVREDLVDMLDLSATTLAWAGIEQPAWVEGQNLFGEDFKTRTFVGGQKDRLDHAIDRVRTIRTDQYRYVRNYKLDRIFLQPQYRDRQNYTQNLHQLYQEGGLSDRHREIYFGERPAEELYDVSVDPCMMQNLVGVPGFEDELHTHRSILEAWLKTGDVGVGEEPIAELKANGEDTKWGEGVNVEYEVYRNDSDGDGLSDKWETLNQRDPNDGLLYFEFDCGGWQTEGWTSSDISSNLAGYLGFLDFTLDGTVGSIQRAGLQVQLTDRDQALLVQLRADADVKVSVVANGERIGSDRIQASDTFDAVSFSLDSVKSVEPIVSLRIQFEGGKGTRVEVDSIEVERGAVALGSRAPIPFEAFAGFERIAEGNPVFKVPSPQWAAAAHAIVEGDRVHYLWSVRLKGSRWELMYSSAPSSAPHRVEHYVNNPVLRPSKSGFDSSAIEYPFPFWNPLDETYYAYYLGRKNRPPKQTGLLIRGETWTDWTRVQDEPIFTIEGPYERAGCSHPSVVVDGDLVQMVYTGERTNFQSPEPPVICHATAPLSDLKALDRDSNNPVFEGSGEAWDSQGVREAEIFKGPAYYHIFYGGHDGTHWRIGHVRTRDFKTFEPNPANPILDLPEDAEAWDAEGLLTPQVFEVGDAYYMLYAGKSGKRWQSGLARASK